MEYKQEVLDSIVRKTMIFRLDGSVSELLALTPVIREWRKRNNQPSVFVETNHPEVFYNNPDVVNAAVSISQDGPYFDLNYVSWFRKVRPVVDTYAESVLGDCELSSWKQFLSYSDSERKVADGLVRSNKSVFVGFDNEFIGLESQKEVVSLLEDVGYDIVCCSDLSVGQTKAAIERCKLFVGSDGDAASVAFTTNTPAVVCYSYRSQHYFPPYRTGVLFEPINPSIKVCDKQGVCYSRNPFAEFSKPYSRNCIGENNYCCMTRSVVDDIRVAVRRIEDASAPSCLPVR